MLPVIMMWESVCGCWSRSVCSSVVRVIQQVVVQSSGDVVSEIPRHVRRPAGQSDDGRGRRGRQHCEWDERFESGRPDGPLAGYTLVQGQVGSLLAVTDRRLKTREWKMRECQKCRGGNLSTRRQRWKIEHWISLPKWVTTANRTNLIRNEVTHLYILCAPNTGNATDCVPHVCQCW